MTFQCIIDFINLTEAKDIYFKGCTFHEDVVFEKLQFKNFFIFEDCTINKNITFQNMTFNKTTSFIQTKFLGEFNLIHTRFDDLALFNEAEIKKLRLDNTFFNKEASFLDITVHELDRETARIIKHSFEKQGNIIESNKFYAKEMEERSLELEKEVNNKDKRNLKSFTDYFIFKIHGITSNHSQDWFLALMWIINLSILFTHFDFFIIGDRTEYYIIPFILNIILTIMIVFDFNNFIKLIWTFLSYLIYIYITSDFVLECAVNNFNPFKKITDITLPELLFKVIIAYLIYHLIVSIRQNTRRK